MSINKEEKSKKKKEKRDKEEWKERGGKVWWREEVENKGKARIKMGRSQCWQGQGRLWMGKEPGGEQHNSAATRIGC